MRFSLNPFLSVEEIDEAARRISRCVQKLRQVSSTESIAGNGS
jgi:cysteine sulfinate desulfinase/cysteine desulfurase-like protein